MTHTKHSNLTDDELLSRIDDARQHSPIIDELAWRLEKVSAIAEDADHRVTCPICEAELEADYDTSNNLFTLEKEQ